MTSMLRTKSFIPGEADNYGPLEDLGLSGWLSDFQNSEEWQYEIFYALSACYALLALVALEHALSLLSSRRSRLGEHNTYANAAATRIQKKFRGWKKRKEFLMIRERIVMIQAHVRGHQARKRYKPIIWSVGILEKVILRWRRKGSGLRGFQGPSTQDAPLKEADDDFLKEGRKQSEERMQKALNRVKSMVQYPEARAQYRRLLNVAEGLRETQSTSVATPSGSENTVYPDEELLLLRVPVFSTNVCCPHYVAAGIYGNSL